MLSAAAKKASRTGSTFVAERSTRTCALSPSDEIRCVEFAIPPRLFAPIPCRWTSARSTCAWSPSLEIEFAASKECFSLGLVIAVAGNGLFEHAGLVAVRGNLLSRAQDAGQCVAIIAMCLQ